MPNENEKPFSNFKGNGKLIFEDNSHVGPGTMLNVEGDGDAEVRRNISIHPDALGNPPAAGNKWFAGVSMRVVGGILTAGIIAIAAWAWKFIS